MERLLSAEQIEFYRDNGFLQVDDVLSADELEDLRTFMEEAMVENGEKSIQNRGGSSLYSKVLNQRVNTWRDHGGMSTFSFHPRLAEMARLLTGAKALRFFHDHALWKMPGDSKPTPWHQDLPYWPMDPDCGALSVWVAADDVDENNGCMMFVPTSHRINTFQSINLVEPQDIFEYAKNTGIENKRPVICRMRAGSCTFHSGRTFHYAHSNQTDRPRRALAIIYMPDGAVYTGKPHVVTDPVRLIPGNPFHGGMFPIVAREREA